MIYDTITLREYAQQLVNDGFNVYVPTGQLIHYLKFEKEGVFGYLEFDMFKGYYFATSNRPNKKHGTGLQVITNASLTLENAYKTLEHCKFHVKRFNLEHVDFSKDTWLSSHFVKLTPTGEREG